MECAMTEIRYSEEILSDLHKDAYGFRPREGFYASWKEMTIEERNREWDMMCHLVEFSIRDEAIQALAAQKDWEIKLTLVAQTCGVKFATAVRWDLGDEQDVGYYCYSNGLAYELEHRIKELVG